jgi:hypothetical protein
MHPDQPVYNKPVRPRASATAALDPWLPALDNTWRFVAGDGRAFVSVPASSPGGLLHLPVRSDAFRDWYFAQTNGTLNRIPTGRTFSMICQYLEADAARIPDNRWNVYRRVGPAGDGAVQIDLSNPAGEYVEITPEGYHVQSGNRGPSFENSATNVSMPAPKSDGSADALERLRGALNLSGADWLRCLTWLVSALSPNGPYPMLVLRGPSGCGKSVAGRVLRGLVDPSSAPFAGMPRSAAQFLHLARQNWVLAFDHVSHITPNLADALCRITSGAGLSAREPGRHDLVQYWIKRPVLLTVTEDCELPTDLAARALVVTLPELTPANRLPEYDLLEQLNHLLSEIFGALCAAISRALTNYRPVPSVTRHAGALAWITAAFPELATGLAAAIAEPPPPPAFLSQLQALVAANPHWEGTAAQLLPQVRAAQTPKGLSQTFNRHALAIADAGIRLDHVRRHGRKVLLIDATPRAHQPSQPKSPQSVTPPGILTPDSCPVTFSPPSPPNAGTAPPHEIRPMAPDFVDFSDNKVL